MAREKARSWRFPLTLFREIPAETPLSEKLYAVWVAKMERFCFVSEVCMFHSRHREGVLQLTVAKTEACDI